MFPHETLQAIQALRSSGSADHDHAVPSSMHPPAQSVDRAGATRSATLPGSSIQKFRDVAQVDSHP